MNRRKARILFTDGFRAAPAWMMLTAVTTLATAVAQLTFPVGIRVMVDALVRHDTTGDVVGVLLTACLFTASWALQIVSTVQGTVLTDRVNVWVSARMAQLVNDVPTLEHFECPDYQTELDQLKEQRRLLAAGPRQVLGLGSVVLRTVGIAALLATVYWPLAFLPLVGLPPYLGDRFSVVVRERADKRLAEQRRLATELFTLAAMAAPAKELRTFGIGGELLRRHDELSAIARRATISAALRGGLCGGLGWLLYAAGFVAAIVLITIRAVHGEATAGQVVLAVSLLRRAQLTVSQASDSIGQLSTTARAADRLIWLEDYAAAASRPRTPTAAPPKRPVDGIRLQNVSFTYPGMTVPVLRDVDLTLPAGTVIGIVGDNGAGKTTLVKLLTGMYQPSSGRILIDDVDLADIPPLDWRAHIAAVFQDFVRWQLVAAETVGIGDLPRIDDRAAVCQALDRAAASGLLAELPDGLDTPLGRSFAGGRDLSGGQWQKLALGRGMIRDCPLLLVLDEPTASLDAAAEGALFEVYINAARQAASASGAITLLVSHRFSTVRLADLIVVVENGTIAAFGAHDDLMAAGGTYAELFQLQASTYR
jgi:ATP-binding cassette, subfamily B, bacterial